MNKRVITGLISAGFLLLGGIAASGGNQSSRLDTDQNSNAANLTKKIPEKVIPTCDGTTVTTNCAIEGASYKTYILHPAIAEKSHTETVTTYHEEITGYCTLCSDGTYSPSCATGRGACSHHGGVAQWNAPISKNVPVENTKTVIDAAAQVAYYEKVGE
ncbi:MAG: hypothetical protein JWO07_124 [Candidatus Saccharibacteria bacterium]|nr:hypothetical protein [Candidatus Saccharibacteria bacterium]